MLPPNTLLRNRYRIFQELGRGGMGAVYQAMDENLNCLVAVKETFATNEQQRRAFKREAELLANLNHPTLPKVTDHFEEGDGQFLVMQFVPGQDLQELLEISRQPFSVEQVVDWADQLLVALEDLHGSKPPIIHRDIKPSNLKLTPKHKVMLLDFGLAKGVAGMMSTVQATKLSSVPGFTLIYAPPEQIRGRGTDARTDLYSLAASLWTLLTAKIPPDALERLAEKDEGKPDPLRPAHEINQKVPRALSELIHQTMSLNRDHRPASAGDLRREFQKLSASGFGKQPQPTVPAPDPKPLPTIPGPPPPVPAPSPPVPDPRDRRGSSGGGYGSVIDPPPIDPTDRLSARWILGAVGVLVIAALVFVFFGLGWRPWARGNTEGAAAQEDRDGAISSNSPSPQNSVSPSPDKSSTQTPSPGSVVRNQIGMELVWIPSGSFVMGFDSGDPMEKPAHRVTLGSGFYMGKYEVTQDQWRAVMGNNPSYFPNCGGDCPVEFVTWDNVQEFIKALNSRDLRFKYRLPSEAEWEYSARGGAPGTYYWGEDVNRACRYENVADQTGRLKYSGWATSVNCSDGYAEVSRVGSFLPNGFGLHDMAGNVSEWSEDRFHSDHSGAPGDGKARGDDFSAAEGVPLATGLYKGGSWALDGKGRADPRPAARVPVQRSQRGNFIGFRLVAIPRSP